jgi:hypothetical protein
MVDLDTLEKIAEQFTPDQQVEIGKWFGKPCLKSNKKVFVVLWGQELVFKLAGDAHAKALKYPGAHLFDPRGKGHAMKEWVQVPTTDLTILHALSEQAFDYVVIQTG